jgi:hypothetical protein
VDLSGTGDEDMDAEGVRAQRRGSKRSQGAAETKLDVRCRWLHLKVSEKQKSVPETACVLTRMRPLPSAGALLFPCLFVREHGARALVCTLDVS